MDKRTPGRNGLAVFSIIVALGLPGCGSVYTLYSIAAPSGEPSAVPDLSGLWTLTDPRTSSVVLRISAEDYDVGHCRNVDIRLLSAYPHEDQPIGDQICFVPVAGHLVAELRAAGPVPLYQQALFKFDRQSISFCSAIWADLRKWSEEHPQASRAFGLEFARRERDVWIVAGESTVTDLFVTSSRSAILAHLESRLKEMPKACDELDKEGHSGWITYIRLTPPRSLEAAAAADTPPLALD